MSFDGDEQAYLKYAASRARRARRARATRATRCWSGSPTRAASRTRASWCSSTTRSIRTTGTIRSRALLDNHDRQFTPGLFARVKLLGSAQHDAVLINDSAIGTDQTVRYVLVVGADNKVEYRPVQLGPVVDGLRVVQSGLTAGETIVVNGLQRVRPGAQVQTQRVAMGERRPGEDAALDARNGSKKDGEARP